MNFWLYLAIVLILAELILPGAVLSFVGIAAGVVGVLVYFGVIEGFVEGLTWFFLSSLVSVLGIRSLFLKYMPGESSKENTSLQDEAIGAIVEVLEEIKPSVPGRISYRGTGWPAISETEQQKGAKVTIAGRSNQFWIVKSLI